MPFFDSSVAEALHVPAILIEGFGLILTATEVFYRRKARAIEKCLHRFSTSSFGDIHRAYRVARGENLKHPLSEVLPTWVIWVVGAMAVLAGAAIGLKEHSWGIGIGAVVVSLFLLFYVLVPLVLFTLSRVVMPFSKCTGGHALGGFGLLLGAAGLLVASYQAVPILLRYFG
jgi:hypothetical protein